MSELNQVLGAILRDITKARVASDLYSMEAYKSYKEDAILQHFPIPRIDISNMEINLKLAISSTDTSLYDVSDESKNVHDDIYVFSVDITRTFVEEYIKLLCENDTIALNTSNLQEINLKQENSVYMLAFADSIAKKLYSGLNNLISTDMENKFIIDTFKVKLSDKIQNELSNSVFCKELEDILVNDLVSEVQKIKVKKILEEYSHNIVSDKLQSKIETISNALSEKFDKNNVKSLQVAVTSEELKNIPDSKITSLKLVLNMQNYLISQVENNKKGDSLHSIHPE